MIIFYLQNDSNFGSRDYSSPIKQGPVCMDPNQRDVVESTLFTTNFTNSPLILHQNNALTCKHITSYQGVENMCKKNHECELNWCINPDKSSLHCTQKVRGLKWGNYQRRQILRPSQIRSHVFLFGTSQIKNFFFLLGI